MRVYSDWIDSKVLFMCLRQYGRRDSSVLNVLWPVYLREARKRNFTWPVVLQALMNLLNPAEMLRTAVAWLWYLSISLSLKAPILFWRELRAASLLQEHHHYPDSLVSILSCYLPLMFKVTLHTRSVRRLWVLLNICTSHLILFNWIFISFSKLSVNFYSFYIDFYLL